MLCANLCPPPTTRNTSHFAGNRKRYSVSLLTASLAAVFSSPAFSYDFSLPERPREPEFSGQHKIEIQNDTAGQPTTENPTGSQMGEWWGPTSETATGNDVHLYQNFQSSSDRSVFGGWSRADGEDVLNNRVVLEQNGYIERIYGGFSLSRNVEKNIVEIYGTAAGDGTFAVWGGVTQAQGGKADENWVYVAEGGKVGGNLAGGDARQPGVDEGSANSNIVLVSEGATVEGNINGGNAHSSAISNAVYIFGTVKGVGYRVYGGQSGTNGTSDRNLLYIGKGGRVEGDAFAAYAPQGEASENVLIIENATVNGNAGAVDAYAGGAYTAGTNNELHLIGNAVVGGGAGANFDGWQENKCRGYDGLVHVRGTASVGSLSGFDRLIVELTEDNVQTAAITITNQHEVIYRGDPILDLTDVSTVINGDTLRDPTQGAVLINSQNESLRVLVNEGTSFSDETSVFVDKAWNVNQEVVEAGGIDIDTVYIDSAGNIMTSHNGAETALGQKSVKASNESHTLSSSFLGTIAFLNQGAEFIADEGIRAMVDAVGTDRSAVFGAMHGGTSRYKTGSHVDVNGVTLATGVATKTGGLTWAGFFEAGWAQSDSEVGAASGDGDHDYYGLGTAMRYTFETPFYLDTSARLGWATTDFSGRYQTDQARYDADSFYGSLHMGLGWIYSISESLNLDVYGRYILMYLHGDEVDLGTKNNEELGMDDTTTHAFRVGFRLNGIFSEQATWRVGLAYEHVADGDAESDVHSLEDIVALDVPSLEGDTGILDLGFVFRPSPTNPWSMNVGLKGYVGDREGVSGNAILTYTF